MMAERAVSLLTTVTARNPVAHARTKHIDIRYDFVREAIQNKGISFNCIPTSEIIACILTKSSPKQQ